MQTRQLGSSALAVSAIGLGCWGMSGCYGAADEAEAEATLRHALDRGINFFDTADSYGGGHNESLVGRVLKSRRHEIVLATKTGFIDKVGPDGAKTTSIDASPQRIRAACDASLTRLQTDYIDLYYLHRRDPTVPIEESVGAMAELVAAGKVRHIGLSEVGAASLRRAHAVHPITALQSEYSLWTRDVEAEILPACAELNVAFVAFSPLGRGFLAGMTSRDSIGPKDFRAKNPRFSAENWQHNTRLVESISTITKQHRCTNSQVALAWLLSRGEHVIPIPGTKRRKHLDENIAALDVDLAPDELASLEAAFPPGAAAGTRYNPDLARWIDR
jgi:aryl-alcohol dehydrogenase-like predicted oxidoreductase